VFVAALLVIIFRSSHSTAIYRLFTTIDSAAYIAASAATSWVFPGDRMQRGVSIATFFDVVLVLATGLQCGVLGLGVGLLTNRRAKPTHE
jgi:hypothetical protein